VVDVAPIIQIFAVILMVIRGTEFVMRLAS